MTEKEIQIFTDSFDRCMRDNAFFDRFYDHFVKSSPEVAAKFSHTDLRRQKREVRTSLYATMEAIVRKESDFSCLDEIARRHSQSGLDIPPRLYRLWVDSIMDAVKHCDHQCDGQIEAVWKNAMEQAVNFMISKY